MSKLIKPHFFRDYQLVDRKRTQQQFESAYSTMDADMQSIIYQMADWIERYKEANPDRSQFIHKKQTELNVIFHYKKLTDQYRRHQTDLEKENEQIRMMYRVLMHEYKMLKREYDSMKQMYQTASKAEYYFLTLLLNNTNNK